METATMATRPTSLLGFSALQPRDYRLIDCLHQHHPHLDGVYESMDDAIADAVGWLESLGPSAGVTSIGVEVSTPNGNWRTIRQPEIWLCCLPHPNDQRSRDQNFGEVDREASVDG